MSTAAKHTPGETMLAIRDGVVSGMVVIGDDEIYRETMAEWAADPRVEEMFRVPVEVARKSFMEPVGYARALLAGVNTGALASPVLEREG